MSTPDGLGGMGRGGILRVSLAAASLVVAGALASAFTDTVDLWVTAPAKIDGTIRPADEREWYVLALPRDAKLTATVKRKGQGDLVPFLDVLHPDLATIEPGVTSGKSTKLKGYVLPESGVYRIRISGDDTNDGDYRAKVKVKPRTAWGTDDGGSVEPAATAEFPFAAPRKAEFKITLTAAKGSAFVPEIVEVRAPDASTVPVDPPDAGATKHKVSGVRTDQNGEHVVVVRNAGGTAGSFSIAVKLSLGKVTKAVVDLRDGEDDELSEEAAIYGRVVDEDGDVVQPTQVDSGISDAAVDVPPGALTDPIVITISADENFFVADGQNAGGVAVEFGPEGATFENAVTITIPFNPQAFDDPENELEISVLNTETGEVETLAGPFDVDEVAGTVTVAVPHFSVYQAVSRRPRPVKGTFFEVELITGLRPGRGGLVAVGMNPVSAKFGARTGNAVHFTENRKGVGWGVGQDGPIVAAIDTSGGPAEIGTVDVLSNTLAEFVLASGNRTYRRGYSDDISVSRTDESLRVFLRQAKRNPTSLTLAGRWHAFVFEFGARETTPGTIRLRTQGRSFRMEVDVDGVVRDVRSDALQGAAGFPGGTWTATRFRPWIRRVRLLPNGPTARLQGKIGADEDLSDVQLIPAMRGDLLIGRAFRSEEDAGGATTAATVRLVALVRGDDDASDASLDGNAFFEALEIEGLEAAAGQANVPVLGVGTRTLEVVHDGGGRLGLQGTGTLTTFDDLTTASQTDRFTVSPDSHPYRIRSDGRYVEPAIGLVGAVTRRRGAYLGLAIDGERIAVVIGVPGPAPVQ